MPRKTGFRSVEFFRKIRDQQASVLAGKSPAEIVAYFSKDQAQKPRKARPAMPKKSARK